MARDRLNVLVMSVLLGMSLVLGCNEKKSGCIYLDGKRYEVSHNTVGSFDPTPVTRVKGDGGIFYDEGKFFYVTRKQRGKVFEEEILAVPECGDGKLDTYFFRDGRRIVEGDDGFAEKAEEYDRVFRKLGLGWWD